MSGYEYKERLSTIFMISLWPIWALEIILCRLFFWNQTKIFCRKIIGSAAENFGGGASFFFDGVAGLVMAVLLSVYAFCAAWFMTLVLSGVFSLLLTTISFCFEVAKKMKAASH